MKLRGVEYGPISCGSGAMGFFGEGYWFHRWLKPFGLDWRGCGFVAKTMTLLPREGNMELGSDGITPLRLTPYCIHVDLCAGLVLNAVGLSNPGAEALLADGRWQARETPFMLSFMPVGATREERFRETQGLVGLLESELPKFKTRPALQVNLSCPNTQHAAQGLEEQLCLLDVLAKLDLSLVPKVAVDYPPDSAMQLSQHAACDALCFSNTVKFGTRPYNWWRKHFQHVSPLTVYGGGGLSGAPLLPAVVRYLRALRERRIQKPLHVGGGILQPQDAWRLLESGADSIFIASVAILRPWRVRSIIEEAFASSPLS